MIMINTNKFESEVKYLHLQRRPIDRKADFRNVSCNGLLSPSVIS